MRVGGGHKSANGGKPYVSDSCAMTPVQWKDLDKDDEQAEREGKARRSVYTIQICVSCCFKCLA